MDKMKSFLTILLLISTQILVGQSLIQQKLDSLKDIIRQSTYFDSSAVFENGEKAIRIARELGNQSEESLINQYYGNFYYFSHDYKAARSYYNKSIEIAKAANDQKIVNSSRIRLAFMLSGENLGAAEKEFKKLLEVSLKNHYYDNTIEIYNGLGIINGDRGMSAEALDYYLKALRIAEKKKDRYHHAMMLNNIGLIKIENKKYKEAEKDLIEGLRIIEGMNEIRLSFNLNNNLGLINKNQKDYKGSIKYFKNTLVNARKLGFPLGMGAAYINLGDSYLGVENYELALLYSDSAGKILQNIEEYIFYGKSLLMKSNIYFKLKQYDKSKAYIDSVFMLKDLYPSAANNALAYEFLADIYSATGNYKAAYENLRIFHDMNDSLNQLASEEKFAQLQIQYGKEKIEAELEEANNKNKLLSKENELKQTKIRTTVIIAILLLLIAAGLFYVRYIRMTRKQQHEFTRKLIENIDDERSRISKDLHDDIGQMLSVIKSKLHMFNTGKISHLEGVDTEISEVIDHTREISHSIHPAFIQKLGLVRSLDALLDKTQEHTDIVCSMVENLDKIPMSVNCQTQIYRILQECINNTIKHAAATALNITLEEEGGYFEIRYQDNGNGLDLYKSESGGMGMMTIRERTAAVGGKVSIQSSKGKGFNLLISIPIAK